MKKEKSLIQQLQIYAWQQEGKKISLPKPQIDEVINIVLDWMRQQGINDVIELLDNPPASKRKRKYRRKPKERKCK